jgi:hypothetical protein
VLLAIKSIGCGAAARHAECFSERHSLRPRSIPKSRQSAAVSSSCGIVGAPPAPVRTMAPEISCKSAAVNSREAAPIQPSTCSRERPPTIAPVTPGQASVHATATADTLAPRNWAQGVAQGQIAAQVRLIEIRRTPAPIIFGKFRDVLPAKRVGQQT